MDSRRKEKGDIKWTRKSGKIWVREHKSKNIYQVSPYEYEQILNNKITESYRIDRCNTHVLINIETDKFANKLTNCR